MFWLCRDYELTASAATVAATTAAAAATVAAAATAAAATTVTASAATTAAATIFLRASFVDGQRATVVLRLVQVLGRFASAIFIFHLDEAKALAAARVAVHDDLRTADNAVLAEEFFENLVGDTVAQVTNVQLLSHDSFL
jgi:hypothetical protein